MKIATEESRQRWNDLADRFGRYEKVMQQSWRAMLPHLFAHVETPDGTPPDRNLNLIEVGSGRGECTRAVLELLKIHRHGLVVASDFSSAMIGIASDALKQWPRVDLIAGLQRASNKELPSVAFLEADAMALAAIPDHSFDVYIANMVLHLVPDPDQMLREAVRVLRQDGIAGFTIWGRPEQSTMFSCKSGGENNSLFEFGRDLDLVRKRILAAGFTRVAMFRVPCILELFRARSAVEFWASIEGRTETDDKDWFGDLLAKFQDVIDRGDQIGLEAVVIIALP